AITVVWPNEDAEFASIVTDRTMQQELVEHLTCSVEAFTGPIMRICGELRESNMKMDQPFIYKLREQAHVCFAILKIPVASRLPFHLVAISTVRNVFNPLQNAFYVRSWYSQTGDGHGVFAKKRTFIAEIEHFFRQRSARF